MSTLNVNAIKDANGANLASLNGVTVTADNYIGMRNRIINGDCRIDQRNAGASVTPSTDQTYTLDRWSIRNAGGAGRFSVVQSSTSAANFPISVLLTNTTTAVPSSNEFYSFEQIIEGYNISDFGWGTANAKTITISFQVRSSLTGTYCVAVRNSNATRSFVSEFTITSANTFETKTVTIPGETSGTWNSTNGTGLILDFCLGSASGREGTAGSWQTTNIVGTANQVDWINTSGATFYITGVQLEVGSVATPFERRPFGTELALCYRYYWKVTSDVARMGGRPGFTQTNQANRMGFEFPVTMRSAPTYSESGMHVWDGVSTYVLGSVGNTRLHTQGYDADYAPSVITTNRPCWYFFQSGAAYIALSAEL